MIDPNKQKKILYMFDEIGKIDDKYINEALLCEKKAVRPVKFSRLLAVAACIALISVMLLTMISNRSDEAPQEPITQPSDTKNTEDLIMITFTEMDSDIRSSFRVPTFDITEDVDGKYSFLYHGGIRLIWTYGNGVYYSVAVSDDNDVKALKDYLANDKTTDFERGREYGDFRFYISYGNGITETPYLSDNGGRFSDGFLSDYLPEVLPSDEFAHFVQTFIEKCISERLEEGWY
ncbi:MAG: hypothetical protein E7633_07775 [Ruminococcaceae bacterium]|nr:hypothetical protein [Oscillospiraceae bacterium]